MGQEKCTIIQVTSHESSLNRYEETLRMPNERQNPRKYDLYDIFCGVLYVFRGGIQWRMLPADYPKWQLVYYYFTVWSKPDAEGMSLLDRLLKKLVKKVRNDNLKRDKTSFGIIDAKSINNGDRINLSVFSIFQRNSRIHI